MFTPQVVLRAQVTPIFPFTFKFTFVLYSGRFYMACLVASYKISS